MELYLLIAVMILLVINLIVLLIQGKNLKRNDSAKMIAEFDRLKEDTENSQRRLRQELTETTQNSVKSLGSMLSDNQQLAGAAQSKKIEEVGKNTVERLDSIHSGISRQLSQMSTATEDRLKTFSIENEKKLENIRQTVETKLTYIQNDNNQKLDEMRKIVDEKLQKTLEDRMTQSFRLVNERLEQVYKGLGEMQTLASGVGDLKKVLSNVKTRGILGEIQLGAILEEILAPEQYDVNVITKKGSKNPVEFAIKLPTEDDKHIYLPIDSKFPSDVYENLVDAYENGSKEQIDDAVKQLKARIRSFAKDISDKYIDSPNTTDFAIMFLPFEGLYAEVVNRGMVESLQRDFKINVAGPSTMAALLNSLQMGFKTFAIQKRSGEVWNVLGAVKTEFDKFGEVLAAIQQRLEQANNELDKLVGVRTRQIQRKLKNITALNQQQTDLILPSTEDLLAEDTVDDAVDSNI
ncbi:MAG: DNA recombination protein RmuC [Clostridiales bacterium]|nr:DNA recombination protein RmuC [Clostridiales bacterium]